MVSKGVATVRAVRQGIAFLADSRSQPWPPYGWCQFSGALPPITDPRSPPIPAHQRSLYKGHLVLGKRQWGREQWFPLFFKGFTQRYDHF